MDAERELAKCEGFDVGIDYGHLYMRGAFNYDGAGQGFGYAIDHTFIERFMGVFRVERLAQVNGRYCWVTHTPSSILRVEPPLPSDGEAFDVLAWSDNLKNRRAPSGERGGGK